MAYFSQEDKAKLAPTVKAILKKYGLKGSVSVRSHMVFTLKIKSGKIDFFESFNRMCSQNTRYTGAGWKPQKEIGRAHV